MLKFLIGPMLVGAGYLAGSIYGRDTEQLVHKSPGATYAAVSQALGNVRPDGTTFFEGGTPMPYELKVEHTPDQSLVVHLLFDGREGAEANLNFVPRSDGKDTLIVAKLHSDHSVLRAALAGTNKARLAYAPDWMLNLSMRPLLRQLAQQIEEGGSAGDAFQGWSPGDTEAQWEANLSDVQREQVSAYQQYQATRPAVDPNAAAQNYENSESN
jgi:hypothetical protein